MVRRRGKRPTSGLDVLGRAVWSRRSTVVARERRRSDPQTSASEPAAPRAQEPSAERSSARPAGEALRHHTLSVVNAVEDKHGVVGVPNESHLPSQPWPRDLFEPHIENLVEEDVRQQWRDLALLEDSAAWVRSSPSSRTPAFNHLPVSLSSTPSSTLRRRTSRRCPWSIESKYSKYFRILSSATRPPAVLVAWSHEACNAWCAERPACTVENVPQGRC